LAIPGQIVDIVDPANRLASEAWHVLRELVEEAA
jgi:hypothetical protein